MNPEQISRLLDLLETIAAKSQTYTLTGAADWPILAFVAAIMVLLIGAMWNDLRGGQKTNKEDFERDIDNLWNGMRDCKADCCNTVRKSKQ